MRADELNDEEKAVVAFLETYFEKQGMRVMLAILQNPATKIDDIRSVIDWNRELYQNERQRAREKN